MAPNGIRSPQPSNHEQRDGARAVGAIILWVLVMSLMCNCLMTSVVIALLVRASNGS